MDQPCTYEQFRACLVDLAQVNRLTLAYRPTMRWLAQHFSRPRSSQPLRIVDVGCGGGDMLRRIEAWAGRNNIPVTLTGVDLNPHAIQAALEFTAPRSAIQYVLGDACTVASTGVDVVVSSLMTHHLEDPEIVTLLSWMDRTAARGWFINDLARGPKAHFLFGQLARVMRWHRFVQHDGPVSIRRGFRSDDWLRLLAAANVHGAVVQPHFPGRLCVSKVRA